MCAASPPRRTLLRLQPAFNAAAHSVYHDDVRIARAGALAVLLAATAAVAVGAVDLRLDAPAITRALSLGQTAIAADLVRFHQPYRVDVQRAPVDYLEIVTPFRRIVLAAQARRPPGRSISTPSSRSTPSTPSCWCRPTGCACDCRRAAGSNRTM